MSEFKVGATAPHFHPWCRCCTAPYFADMEGVGRRFARDPDDEFTYTVPKDMTYKQWKAMQDEQIAYMSNSFKPVIQGKAQYVAINTNQISLHKVENSEFDMYTDGGDSTKNLAVRLAEKNMRKVKALLPDGYELPRIAVVDYSRYAGFEQKAIAGYHADTNTMFINSAFKSSKSILAYVNKHKGYFSNNTELAPYFHELGHNYYEKAIKRLAKSQNIEYNIAKNIVDGRIYDYIHARNASGMYLTDNISMYADDGYLSYKYTEIIAECFAADKTLKPEAQNILDLLI